MIERLSAKQVEVLDLLLLHRTTKEIARELAIAPNTVDQRIAGVREKWGTRDRKQTARVYAAALEICGQSPCGLSRLNADDELGEPFGQDLTVDPVFTLSDVAPILRDGSWGDRPTGLEALDARFGRLGRVTAILLLALVLVLTIVSSLAIANALNELM
ncbi:helix-turn-helix transcriptional regulator [Novosphingobium sp. PC22D]|uniref:helix-turn-helix domain-containing protein n=1 Tax=Novosphingobium sp. PC22D TaxID=1962403 RepID=UPI000BF22C87|nr:helix-turn-helix transcriptional regulator [Novosphingobium sp. PC22D]